MTIRKNNGQGLAEVVAATVFALPVLVVIMLALCEVSQFFLIETTLQNAARQAARDLAIDYTQIAGIDTNATTQATYVFNNIRYHNIVNSSAQFYADFNEVDYPNTVTVTVTYTSGSNGLPKFPNFDPLNLGSKLNLSSTSVYRLE